MRTVRAVALLGSATAPIVTATALTAEQLRVPLVTSQMPVEAFASGDKTGWTYSWDLFYDEKQQAADAAKALAATAGDRKVALFTDNEPDSVVERPLYEAAFKADGLDVVGDYTFPVGTTHFSSYIAAAKASGAQQVAGQLAPADAAALGKRLGDPGFHPKAAFLAGTSQDGYQSPALGRLAQGRCRQATGAPARPRPDSSPSSAPRSAEYAGRAGYAPAAVGYAVAEVLTDALAAAGSTNPAKLNTAIAHTDTRHHGRTGHLQPVHAHGDHRVPRHRVSRAGGGGSTQPVEIKVFFPPNGPWFHVSSTRGTAASRARASPGRRRGPRVPLRSYRRAWSPRRRTAAGRQVRRRWR